MNLEWLKKHKYAAAAGGAVLLLLLVVMFRRNASSGSSLGSAITAQNQDQLQMAQLNAQLSSQSEQTQAQLAATEYQTQAQEEEQQTGVVGSILGNVLPIQYENQVYGEELAAEQQEQTQLLPLEETAQQQIGRGGSLEGTGADELALLLGEASAAQYPVYGQASTSKGFGFGLTLPNNIGVGLFG